MTSELIDYKRIEKAIEFIHHHFKEQPQLDIVAGEVGVSPFHFQRLFKRWAGVSPKKFLQYITLEYLKKRLQQSANLNEVAYDSGLSGSGRLYDLYFTFEGMTPLRYKSRESGIIIYYDFFTSPFGKYLLAVTQNNKICTLSFTDDKSKAVKELSDTWFNSKIVLDREKTSEIAKKLFHYPNDEQLEYFMKGTQFQLKVWEALLRIPFGHIVTYQEVSETIQKPGALQAVGSAIGKNPIAFLIPCHRVIRKTGAISAYRWGAVRKKALIGWELCKADSQPDLTE
jgi:AraC family transcriptional regulator, regulatory protein of adaptative response / methylated-DNA-[protein]-cysteine methyltransferase